MSDTAPTNPEAQKPQTKTSTVPLKKETVRITLRARPEDTGPVAPKGSTAPLRSSGSGPIAGGTGPIEDVTAPISALEDDTTPTGATAPAPATVAPAAPEAAMATVPVRLAPPSPPAPSVPSVAGPPVPPSISAPSAPRPPAPPSVSAPKPPGVTAPKPSAPPAPPSAPRATAPLPAAGGGPIGAKTIPLAKSPSPSGAGPIGAKTIPLAKGPSPTGPMAGKSTTPLAKPGGASPLPQATVQLAKTGPLPAGGPPTSPLALAPKPNIKSTAAVEEEWEEEFEESGLMPFAIVVLLLAIGVLVIEILTKMAAG